VTPAALLTVNVPVPNAVIVKVPLLPPSFMPAMTIAWPTWSGWPEIKV
jgi:hypothetical protein